MTRHWENPQHSDEWAKQGRRLQVRALEAARGRVLAKVDRDARALQRRRGPLPGADVESFARAVGNGRRGAPDLGDHR